LVCEYGCAGVGVRQRVREGPARAAGRSDTERGACDCQLMTSWLHNSMLSSPAVCPVPMHTAHSQPPKQQQMVSSPLPLRKPPSADSTPHAHLLVCVLCCHERDCRCHGAAGCGGHQVEEDVGVIRGTRHDSAAPAAAAGSRARHAAGRGTRAAACCEGAAPAEGLLLGQHIDCCSGHLDREAERARTQGTGASGCASSRAAVESRSSSDTAA
jgi:hypothetical protein